MHIVQTLVYSCALALGNSQDTLLCSEAGKASFSPLGLPELDCSSLEQTFPREKPEPQAGSELHLETGELSSCCSITCISFFCRTLITEPGTNGNDFTGVVQSYF